MRTCRNWALVVAVAVLAMSASPRTQGGSRGATSTIATPLPPKLAAYKSEAVTSIDGMYDLAQQMVDSVFSFSELGFQEFETQRYLTAILEKEGFTIQRGIAGIPSAWTARFGSGKPVIAPGSDIDCIPQASTTDASTSAFSSGRITWSPTAAISRTSSRRPRRSGTTSGR